MDRDGDLDLFLANHSLSEYTGVQLEMNQLKQKKNPDYCSKLYRNDGSRFTDITEAAGITGNVLSFGLGIGITDVNGDHWPDIYVCNDFNEQDYLFVNNQNGTFTDRLPEYLDHTSLFSMGCDWSDLNNDGLQDLVTVDMLPEDNFTQKMHMGAENYNKFQGLFRNGFYYQYSRNMLHLNNGDGTFSEIGQLAGVSNTDWSWAPLCADFDNDGLQDLFVTNGYVKDYTDMDFLKYSMDQVQGSGGPKANPAELLKKMKGSQLANYLFQQQGTAGQTPVFKNVAEPWGLGGSSWSYGAAYADLDNDGDLDLITNNIDDYASIFRNNAEKKPENHWFSVVLQDPATPGNRAAIGAKVSVWAGGVRHYRELMPSRGYASSVDPRLLFGLGKAAEVDSIVIIWPDGSRQKESKTAGNQRLQIEKKHTLSAYAASPTPAPLFKALPVPDFQHREDPTQVDFKTQVLLPHFLSRQGPCLAQADVDGDGWEDLYIGGGKGQEGVLWAGRPQGAFVASPSPVFSADKACDDTGAAFFDADGDKDVDLYVASGGYGQLPLQDRLYLNDGRGHFNKAEGALPSEAHSGSCVRPADVDGDGDQDLFVGGRVVPGRYPEAPASMLLINDGRGRFEDKTESLAPGLARAGMVTDAQWADLNGDRQPDLVLVGEWMPVRVFDNAGGKLTESSEVRAPAHSGGWWNCLQAADMDGDGDTDFILGNLGQNAQIKADAQHPATLDYGDFDKNGSVDPILCWYFGETSYPGIFRDELGDQLPMMKKKFTDYKSYANATLEQVLNPEQLSAAKHLEAPMLSSCYMENQGGKLILHPLPTEAQYAPVYAALCVDANGDGHKDLLLAGNQRYTRIRFGRYDANHGMLFLGDGKGGFQYVNQNKSGFKLRADVRSAVLLQQKGRPVLVFGVNDGSIRGYGFTNIQ